MYLPKDTYEDGQATLEPPKEEVIYGLGQKLCVWRYGKFQHFIYSHNSQILENESGIIDNS